MKRDNGASNMKLQLKYGKFEISADGEKDEVLKVIKEAIALLKNEGVLPEIHENIEQQEKYLENINELGIKYPETITGGFIFLLDNGFFNEPKLFDEVMNEMHRIGLVYDKSSLSSTLSKWHKKERKIKRLGSAGSYKYVKVGYRKR